MHDFQSSTCPSWAPECFPSLLFSCRPHRRREKPFSRCRHNHSQVWNFSQPLSNKAFPIVAPAAVLPTGVRANVLRAVPRGLACPLMIFGGGIVVDNSRKLEHCHPGTPNRFGVDTASLACPAHPRSRKVTSRTLAAVTCDAEDPCSVNTAYELESSYAASPRCTTRPLCVWNFFSNSEFGGDTQVHERCNMHCLAFSPCFLNHF